MRDYEETFEEFWRDIVAHPDGTLDEDAVKRELHDYHNMLHNVPLVYDHVTNGLISKPNTLAHEVINAFDDYVMSQVDSAIYEVRAGDDL